MPNLSVLICSYNRKHKTQKCLQGLFNQSLPQDLSLNVYLLDDASSDGTADMVKQEFPTVHLLKGDGNHFWCGGMRKVWQQALRDNQSDAYLWLNDDVELQNDAISRLWFCYSDLIDKTRVGAIVGTLLSPETGNISYGGRGQKFWWHPLKFTAPIRPGDKPKSCDFINGNFTLISPQAVQTIGILQQQYTHGLADFDFGLRLKKAHMAVLVAPGTYGYCDRNSKNNSIVDAKMSLDSKLELLKNPAKSVPYNEQLFYIRSHGKWLTPILMLITWLKKCLPKSYLWCKSWKYRLLESKEYDWKL